MSSNIRKMHDAICSQCPYMGRIEVPYEGNKNADIVIVGMCPGVEEEKSGVPFFGDSGRLLNKLLKAINLDRRELYITNATRCMIKEKEDSIKDINKAISLCRQFLKSRLLKTKPKLIVLLGKYALGQILGKQKLMENRGRFFYSDEFKCLVFSTVHMAYILRRGVSSDFPFKPFNLMSSNEKLIYSDFQQIKKCADSGFKAPFIEVDKYRSIEDLLMPNLPIASIDSETTGLDLYSSAVDILSVGITSAEGSAEVCILDGKVPPNIKAMFSDPRIPKVVSGRPFEEAVGRLKLGVDIRGEIHDVLEMGHLVDENYYSYSLESLAGIYTDLKNIKDLAEGHRFDLQNTSKETLIKYTGGDADANIRLFNVFRREINRDKELLRYYKKFILPVQDLCTDMYFHGIKVDKKMLADSEKEAVSLLKKLEDNAIRELPKSLKEKHNGKLNLSRPDLIRDYLFSKQGLSLVPNPQYLTPKTRVPQTSESHLNQYKYIPFVEYYLEYMQLAKIYNSYLKTMWNYIRSDGYVHPSTVLNRTKSGRAVMVDPPLQIIPQRGKYAYLTKRIFVAEPEEIIGTRDLSQAEFRVMGWLAKDKNILEAINNGVDLHVRTAALILSYKSKKPIEGYMDKITEKMRQDSKGANFGLIYGLSIAGIDGNGGLRGYLREKYDVELSILECQLLHDAFFSKPDGYYSLPSFFAHVKREVHKKGYIRTAFGRIRRLPAIYSKVKSEVAKAERQAINMVDQSLSSDLTFIGFKLFNDEIKSNQRYRGKVSPFAFHHDAVMFRAKSSVFDSAMKLLKECMEERSKEYVKKNFNVDLNFRIDSEGKIGKNWADLKKYERS